MNQGLHDPSLIAKKRRMRRHFERWWRASRIGRELMADDWEAISGAESKYREILKPLRFRSLGWSSLSLMALHIVQYVTEVKKPDGERLEGFHDSQLDSLRFRLFSPAPVYRDFEQAMLAGFLELCLDELGPDDPVHQGRCWQEIPRRQWPRKRMSGTKVVDAGFRKALVEGGEAAVQASTDPLIVLARKVDPWRRQDDQGF